MPNRVAPKFDVEYLRRIDWWSKVDVRGPDECWPWKLSTGSHGYGQTWDRITIRLAHRVAWVLTFGSIPDGLTVDHWVCQVRLCCNPAHLRLLSNADNARDANDRRRKPHCPLGHPYDEANTYRTKRGTRQCRKCRVRWRPKARAERAKASEIS